MAASTEYQRLLDLKAAGTYVPPAKLRQLQKEILEQSSTNSNEVQRLKWEELKKAINGMVNKVNKQNIREIIRQIFSINLVRGRGLFCRSIMRAQASSLSYTPVYAALVSVLNTKLPDLGQLLCKRLVVQFRKSFRRKDRTSGIATAMFICHLVNQQVMHEVVVLEILHLMLHTPTDDSVEIAVAVTRECGMFLAENSAAAFNGVFERFRAILHESKLDKRVQYMVEVLFQVRKDGFADNPSVEEDLDLVDEEDQVTHMIGLDDQIKTEDSLNVFKFDEHYDDTEKKYDELKHEILGEGEESEGGESESEEEEEEEQVGNEEEYEVQANKEGGANNVIIDKTNTDVANLRRTIYLTVMSSMSIDEIAHKLARLPTDDKQQIVDMIIECCSQEKTYNRIYGGVGQRLIQSSGEWHDLFVNAFSQCYSTVHRYTVSQSRNIARLFGVLLSKDVLDWSVFQVVSMNERDTNPSSRVFLKDLFDELKQELGVPKLVKQFKDPYLEPYLTEMMPKGPMEDTMFSINYFTAIGLGVLTDDMREWFKREQERLREQEEENEERGRLRERRSGEHSRDQSFSASDRSPSSGRISRRSPPTRSPSPVRIRNNIERPPRELSRSPSPVRVVRRTSPSPSPVRVVRKASPSPSPVRMSKGASSPPAPVRAAKRTRSPSPPPPPHPHPHPATTTIRRPTNRAKASDYY